MPLVHRFLEQEELYSENCTREAPLSPGHNLVHKILDFELMPQWDETLKVLGEGMNECL